MTPTKVPYLCGGILFSLILQARKTRTKARDKYHGGSDGLKDTDVMMGLVEVVTGDSFVSSQGKTFGKCTTQFKTCQDYGTTYIPFTDSSVISSFTSSVKQKDPDLLKRMSEFINKYINEMRSEWLVRIDKLLKDALTECSFPNLTTARLNLSSFDVEINGRKKQSFNGQGYTSFLNSIIAMSFRQYLSEYAVYDPGLLVIDTPLLGLDQGVSDVSPESMRASLYTYFTNHQDCGQVILLDNMKDVPAIDFESTGTNVITFTKGLEEGRYGFLMDVTD